MPSDLTCPVCGSILKWSRSAESVIASAHCQDGMGVSRRLPGKAVFPCLWRGGNVVIVKNHATHWATLDGKPPLEIWPMDDLWTNLDYSNTETPAYVIRVSRSPWVLKWTSEAGWLLSKGGDSAIARDKPGEKGAPPFRWATIILLKLYGNEA